MTFYKQKYLKYKLKFLKLKNQYGGEELSQDELKLLFNTFQRGDNLTFPLLIKLLTVKKDKDLYELSLKLRLSMGFPNNLTQSDLTTGSEYGNILAIIFTQNVNSVDDNQLNFSRFVDFVKCGVNRNFEDLVATNINCKNQRDSEEIQRKQKEAEEREKQREEREKQRREAEERQRREREQREAERERERQQREAERERERQEEKERKQREREANDKRFEEELRQLKNEGEEERKRYQRFEEERKQRERERKEEEERRERREEEEERRRRQRVAEVINRNQREDRDPNPTTSGTTTYTTDMPRVQEAEERIQRESRERMQKFNSDLRERYGQPQNVFQPGYPQQGYYQQPRYSYQQQDPYRNKQYGGKLEPDYNGIKFRIYKK
jgi:hypothetical protein